MASHGIGSATINAARATTPNTCLILGRDRKTTRANTSNARYPCSIGYARVSMARVDEHLGQFRNAEDVLSGQFARLRLAGSSRPIRAGRSSVDAAADPSRVIRVC